MAKTAVVTTEPTPTPATPAAVVISAATKRLVDDIREPFRGFVDTMGGLLTTRAKLAPKFMKAANAWRKEMGAGTTFIAFVRELDPSVPKLQKEYTKNAVFNAAVYLKRLVDAQSRGEGAGASAERTGPPPLPPMTGLARLLAAITPLVPADNLTKLWAVIAEEMHWSEAQKERLKTLSEEAEPLIAMRTPRGAPKPVLHIIQPRHSHLGVGGDGKQPAIN